MGRVGLGVVPGPFTCRYGRERTARDTFGRDLGDVLCSGLDTTGFSLISLLVRFFYGTLEGVDVCVGLDRISDKGRRGLRVTATDEERKV